MEIMDAGVIRVSQWCQTSRHKNCTQLQTTTLNQVATGFLCFTLNQRQRPTQWSLEF